MAVANGPQQKYTKDDNNAGPNQPFVARPELVHSRDHASAH